MQFGHGLDALGRPCVLVFVNGEVFLSVGLDELPSLFRVLARQIRHARRMAAREIQ